MRKLLTLIPIIILVSSCSFGKDGAEVIEETSTGDIKVEVLEDINTSSEEEDNKKENKESGADDVVKDNTEEKDNTSTGIIITESTKTSTTDNESKTEEEEIVKEFEAELDDLFKSLEGYE